MIAMICGFATNVALDYTFVWVLGRGMYGAALATIIGQGSYHGGCTRVLRHQKRTSL